MPNTGRLDPQVRYYGSDPLVDVFFTTDAVVFDLKDPVAEPAPQSDLLALDPDPTPAARSGQALFLQFPGANEDVEIVAEDASGARYSFFYGNDPQDWVTDRSGYRTVTYRNLWDGVDLVFTLDRGTLSYRLEGDSKQARLEWAGADRTTSDGGTTLLETRYGTLADDGSGISRRVDDTTYNIQAPEKGLNALLWSTLLGGSDDDTGSALAVASNGDVFVFGETRSPDLPGSPGAYHVDYYDSQDLFVARFADQGATLLWCTYLGSSSIEYATTIALDDSDNPVVGGRTQSPSYPTTAGAYSETFNGGIGDDILTKLSADGSSLIFSTYFGGSDVESFFDIRYDVSGHLVCAGYTASTDFPTTPGCYQDYFAGPPYDMTVSILSGDGSTLLASTYVGGTDRDACRGLAIDGNGDFLLSGFTFSGDFPVTAGAFQTTKGTIDDGALVKMSSDLSTLMWATFIGGNASERSLCISLDSNDDPVIAGYTRSTDFPTSTGVLQENFDYGTESFVAKFNNLDGTRQWSTYLGGNGYDEIVSLEVDGNDHPVATGWTGSDNFPVTSLAYDTTHNGGYDIFVSRLAADGSAALWSTYLGSSGNDQGLEIALDSGDNPVITGSAGAADFPVSSWAYDTTHNGLTDAVLARFDTGSADLAPVVATSPVACGGSTSVSFVYHPDPPHTPLLRGYSVSVQAPAGLSFAASDVQVASPLAGVNDTFQVVENAPGDVTIDFSFLDSGAGLDTSAELFSIEVTTLGADVDSLGIVSGIFRDPDNHPFDVDISGVGIIEADCEPPLSPTLAAEPLFTAGATNTVQWSDEAASGAVSYNVQASDTVDFSANVIESGFIAGLTYEFTGLTDGATYYYRVVARDDFGQDSAPSAVESSTQDAGAPVSSADAMPDHNTATFDVPYTASDAGVGVASVELFASFEGGAFASAGVHGSSPISFTATQGDGLYGFYTVAVDSFGNTQAAADSVQASCLLDMTAPVSAVDSLATYQSTATFAVTAAGTDDASGLAGYELFYRLDAGSWTSAGQDAGGVFGFTAAADGFYEFYSVATDSAGNQETAPAAADASTTVDTNGPAGTFTIDGGVAATNDTTVVLDLAVTDAVQMRFSNDNVTFEEGWVPFAASHGWTIDSTPGLQTVYAEFRDVAENVLQLTATIELDLQPTGAVSLLDAFPSHETVSMTWHDPEDTDLDHVEIWRGLLHDGAQATTYPEYAGAVVPTDPADRASALASAEWTLAGSVAGGAEAFVDSIATRGIYYYQAFAVDAAGNFSAPAASSPAATNYILGDMSEPFDGLVHVADLTVLGATYGLTDGQTGFNPHADVGPTADYSSSGLPQPDDVIDFEDLMITAGNYTPTVPAAGEPELKTPQTAPVALAWDRTDESTFTLYLVDGDSGLKGLNLSAVLPEDASIAVAPGSLCASQTADVFLRNIDSHGLDAGCALLGSGLSFTGTGDLLTVSFADPAHADALSLEDLALVLRNADNEVLQYTFESATAVNLPQRFELGSNYPNPFNPMTRIRFSLPQQEHVRLEIYAVDGRRVAVLLDENVAAGYHEITWTGKEDGGRQAASGLYFYRIHAGENDAVRKMTLVK